MRHSFAQFARRGIAFLREGDAAAATEYSVLLAAMIVAVVGAVTYLGIDVAGTVSMVSNEAPGASVAYHEAPSTTVLTNVVIASNSGGAIP